MRVIMKKRFIFFLSKFRINIDTGWITPKTSGINIDSGIQTGHERFYLRYLFRFVHTFTLQKISSIDI